jgi:hypothetical protein
MLFIKDNCLAKNTYSLPLSASSITFKELSHKEPSLKKLNIIIKISKIIKRLLEVVK